MLCDSRLHLILYGFDWNDTLDAIALNIRRKPSRELLLRELYEGATACSFDFLRLLRMYLPWGEACFAFTHKVLMKDRKVT